MELRRVLQTRPAAFWRGGGTRLVLVGSIAGKATVALRAATVDGLHQEPVDLLTELSDVWGQGPLLQTSRQGKDVLIQWRAGLEGIKVNVSMYSVH